MLTHPSGLSADYISALGGAAPSIFLHALQIDHVF